MFPLLLRGRLAATLLLAFGLAVGSLLATTVGVFAHARYDRSEPPSGSNLDGSPFVRKTCCTQEWTSLSTIRGVDANGVQVDLGDGRVDLDDPIRKLMTVSLPELPVGLYRVEFAADSAEDGHMYPGSFAFGVGMDAPSGAVSSD